MQCFTQKNANLGDGRGEINESSNCSWESARMFVTVVFLGLRNANANAKIRICTQNVH